MLLNIYKLFNKDINIDNKTQDLVDEIQMKILGNNTKDSNEYNYFCFNCEDYVMTLNGIYCSLCNMEIVISGINYKQLKVIKLSYISDSLNINNTYDDLINTIINNTQSLNDGNLKKNEVGGWDDNDNIGDNTDALIISSKSDNKLLKFLKSKLSLDTKTIKIDKQAIKNFNIGLNDIKISDFSDISGNYPIILYKKIINEDIVFCNTTGFLYSLNEIDEYYSVNNSMPYV